MAQKTHRRSSLDSSPKSLLPRCRRALRAAVLKLLGRNQDFRRHSRHKRALGIIEAHFQDDGLDIPLPPAYVALRSEVTLDSFKENLAVRDGAAGKPHSQH